MSLMSFTERNSRSLIASEETISRRHYLMGTFVEIEAGGKERSRLVEIIELAFSEMKRIERILSKYLDGSEISKLNQFAHLFPVEVNPEVFELLEESVKFFHLSHGCFDVTCGSIMALWNLAERRGFLPREKEIKEIGLNTGGTNIMLNPEKKTVFFNNPSAKIDLGGIGKGYAVDRAIEIFKRKEIKKAMVNAGGNIFCMDEDYSNIGIKDPLNPEENIITVLVKDKAISTSANYERFFKVENSCYGHLINPGTGYPVDNGVLSVSVISSSAKIADILSTAVFVLGRDKGMELIERTDGVEGVIITAEGRRPKLYISSGLSKIFESSYILN